MVLFNTMEVFLLSICFGTGWCQLIGDTPWDTLITTFPKFISVPTSETQAISSNWTAIMKCDDNDSPGNVYWTNEDLAAMPIYNADGQIAGIIIGIDDPGQSAQTSPWQQYNVNDAIFWGIESVFRDPETICKPQSTADIKYGDRLWFADVNGTYTKIPLNESSVVLENEGWVKGGCKDGVFKMGVHYWRYSAPDIDCNDAYPVFILYDNGILHAWGVAMGNKDRPSPNTTRWEHPPGSLLTGFFLSGDAPTCLAEQTKLYNSMHVYMTSSVLAETTTCVSTPEDDSGHSGGATALIFAIIGSIIILGVLIKCVCMRSVKDEMDTDFRRL